MQTSRTRELLKESSLVSRWRSNHCTVPVQTMLIVTDLVDIDIPAQPSPLLTFYVRVLRAHIDSFAVR
jgi:hypothetical protein